MTIPKRELLDLLGLFVGQLAEDPKWFKHYVENGWTIYVEPDTKHLATLARIAADEDWDL